MFENQGHELDIDDDDVPEKDDFFEKNNAYEFSMKLPVKAHIYKIEESIKDVQNYLETCPNQLEILQESLKEIEQRNKNELEKFSKEFYPALNILTKEVKKIIEIENNELFGLKKQTHQLSQERIKLQNDTLVLENKVVETDKDLGFKLKPDIKNNKFHLTKQNY